MRAKRRMVIKSILSIGPVPEKRAFLVLAELRLRSRFSGETTAGYGPGEKWLEALRSALPNLFEFDGQIGPGGLSHGIHEPKDAAHLIHLNFKLLFAIVGIDEIHKIISVGTAHLWQLLLV